MKPNGSLRSMREVLRVAVERLAAVSEDPRLEAEWIAAHAVGISRNELLLKLGDIVEPEAFEALIDRRANGEPLAYILGSAEFRGLELVVGPGVLIPRPDTETLIEAAIEHFGDRSPKTILDLGTGSGALLLAALSQWPDAGGLGIDASDDALGYARQNVEKLGLSSCARFSPGNWFENLDGQFDLILSNPPYIGPDDPDLADDVRAHEPGQALFAGPDGLDAIRAISDGLAPRLAHHGVAVIEIGWKQREAASALFKAQGFAVSCQQDAAGRDRALLVTG